MPVLVARSTKAWTTSVLVPSSMVSARVVAGPGRADTTPRGGGTGSTPGGRVDVGCGDNARPIAREPSSSGDGPVALAVLRPTAAPISPAASAVKNDLRSMGGNVGRPLGAPAHRRGRRAGPVRRHGRSQRDVPTTPTSVSTGERRPASPYADRARSSAVGAAQVDRQ